MRQQLNQRPRSLVGLVDQSRTITKKGEAMALFRTPERHADNPPETWQVVKVADHVWHLRVKDHSDGDGPLDSFTTKKAAEASKDRRVQGWLVRMYEEEGRWFAGETKPGMRSYAECKPEIDRAEAHA